MGVVYQKEPESIFSFVNFIIFGHCKMSVREIGGGGCSESTPTAHSPTDHRVTSGTCHACPPAAPVHSPRTLRTPEWTLSDRRGP